MPSATFSLSRAKRGVDQVHAVVTTTIDGTRYPIAAIAIADPITYTDGFKSSRLLKVDEIVAALSDLRGPIQATRASFEMSDIPDPITGQTIFRQWLHERKRVRGAEVDVTVITDEQRRFGWTPKTVFRGLVEDYDGGAGFRARFKCVGILGPALKKYVVTRTIGESFKGCPSDVQNLPVPLALGRLTDVGSATAAPTPTAEAARGVTATTSGFGDAPGTPATSPTITENASAGTVQPGTYRAQIFAYHGTVAANPAPFLSTGLEITISPGTSAITVGWAAASGGADFYRVALCVLKQFGPTVNEYWQQYIQTTGTSVQFTDTFTWDRAQGGLTPGAEPVDGEGWYWEAMSADMAAGPTPLSTPIFSAAQPFSRPRRMVVTPIGGAIRYWLWRLGAVAGFTRRIEVPVSQLNGDGNIYADYDETSAWTLAAQTTPKGAIRPIIIGSLTDLNGESWPVVGVYSFGACDVSDPVTMFLVENEGQVDEIVTPLDPSSSSASAPGQAGHATRWGAAYYTDSLGFRWMLVAYRGGDWQDIIDGTKILRINALGMDDVGDSTGAVIEIVPDQIAALFDNLIPFAATSALGGDLNTSPPVFGDGTEKRDVASFALAIANAAIIMPEGLDGARWITERITWGDLFAEMLRSVGLRGGINPDGQLQIVFTNPYQTPITLVSEIDEILKDSFVFSDTAEGFATRQPYEYRPDYANPGGFPALAESGEVISVEAEADERFDADVLILPWKLNAVQAKAVAELALQESARLPRVVQMQSGIHWAMWKLGDMVPVVHREGPFAGGYTGQVLQVSGVRLDVESMTVEATCLEVRRTGTDGQGNAYNDRYRRAWLAIAAPPTNYWLLDEKTGTVAVDSVGSSDGTIAGAPTLGVAMPEGARALQLDGSNDGVDWTGLLEAMGTTWYLGARLTYDISGGDARAGIVFSSGMGLMIEKATRRIGMYFSGTDHFAATPLVDLVETTIVLECVNGAGTFYLDDVAAGTFTSCPTWTPSPLTCSASGERLKGLIRDITIGPGLRLTAAERSVIFAAR